MGRVVNILFAIILLILVVVLVDPNARQRAAALVERWEPTLDKWEDTIIVNMPSMRVTRDDATPVPTVTPIPTKVADDDDEIIPTTGEDDTDDEPIVQINWDELKEAFQEFWNDIRNIRIDFNTNDNK